MTILHFSNLCFIQINVFHASVWYYTDIVCFIIVHIDLTLYDTTWTPVLIRSGDILINLRNIFFNGLGKSINLNYSFIFSNRFLCVVD